MKTYFSLVFLLVTTWLLAQNSNYVATNSLALQIENSSFNDNYREISNENSLYANVKRTKKKPTSKLLRKANDYFEKMWYTEAAALYEKVLERQAPEYSFEVLKKAANAYYFNTQMNSAHDWFEEIFDNHRENVTPDILFKYANTLKGIKKYGKSKRMMRLYRKALKGQDISTEDNEKEVSTDSFILDKLLKKEANIKVININGNTKFSEFSPAFLGDDKLVYASAKDSSFQHTRIYKWNEQPYLDLYVTSRNNETMNTGASVSLSKNINSKYHEAGVSFSKDQKTVYFTRNNYKKKLKGDKNGISHLKIFKSQFVDGKWSEPAEVSFNSDSYSTGHPALSADGKKLYFVSDMPGTLGETDIFVVDILEDGSFSAPKNLGPDINTPFKEMFPYVTDQNLYFTSNGHQGLGGLDIFKAVKYTDGSFGNVDNLGKPYNSNLDDFSFIINEHTQNGYFASNREGGKGDDDIYAFIAPPLEIEEIETPETIVATEQEPEETSVTNNDLKEALDSDNNTMENDPVAIEENTEKIPVVSNEAPDYLVEENGITKFKTEAIYFDFDKATIRQKATLELDKLVSILKENEGISIKIESHTDSRGSRAYNKVLSDRRAKASRAYLISKGIASDRIISAIGYGEERLINECGDGVECSRENHERNRRSEFIVINP
ncbi:OmpA family protein [Flavobacteriaceae bacterium M23B6Z8]